MATANSRKASTNKNEDPRQAAGSSDEPKATGAGRRQLLAANEEPTAKLAKVDPVMPEDDIKKMVTVVVPKAFNLTCDDGSVIRYEVGIQDMPKAHATNWYAQAQGVTIK